MIKRNEKIGYQIQKWKDSKNLWEQRASCVSFVKLARHGNHTNIILDICSETVKSSERFVQLANGWVLRELYLASPEEVVSFIKENYIYFSREGLRYATEKMNAKQRSYLLTWNPNTEKAVGQEIPLEDHSVTKKRKRGLCKEKERTKKTKTK
eukprot:TRINITY_DN6709_c0_g1_i3.p1 TRINITY_DN6709_c0_g1~~TRINITY_DN6709_c0_g1_i3.p1  ORF type:complete len:153 (+),score=24.78 TRINITY_DN6709_c0_g1_i3:651-1109(+)